MDGKKRGPVHETLFWAGQLAFKWVNNADDETTAPPAWAVRKGRWMLRYWSNPSSGTNSMTSKKPIAANVTTRGGAAPEDIVRPMKADYAAWYRGTRTPMGWGDENWKALAPGD